MNKQQAPISFEDIQAVFGKIDGNKDGSLSREELHDAFSQVPGIDKNQIENIFDKIDKNGDGEVDLEEFIEMSMFNSSVENSEVLMKLIQHYVEILKNE